MGFTAFVVNVHEDGMPTSGKRVREGYRNKEVQGGIDIPSRFRIITLIFQPVTDRRKILRANNKITTDKDEDKHKQAGGSIIVEQGILAKEDHTLVAPFYRSYTVLASMGSRNIHRQDDMHQNKDRTTDDVLDNGKGTQSHKKIVDTISTSRFHAHEDGTLNYKLPYGQQRRFHEVVTNIGGILSQTATVEISIPPLSGGIQQDHATQQMCVTTNKAQQNGGNIHVNNVVPSEHGTLCV